MSVDVSSLISGIQTGEMAHGQISSSVLKQVMSTQQTQANAIVEMVQDTQQMVQKRLQSPDVGVNVDVAV